MKNNIVREMGEYERKIINIVSIRIYHISILQVKFNVIESRINFELLASSMAIPTYKSVRNYLFSQGNWSSILSRYYVLS